MKKKHAVKLLSVLMAVCILVPYVSIAPAQAGDDDLSAGVTVQRDVDSPTGYTVTFVYHNAAASKVELAGQLFNFFALDDEMMEHPYTPHAWRPGLYSASPSGRIHATPSIYYAEMENIGNEYWTVTLPLPSGNYPYFFAIDGDRNTRVEDSANPRWYNPDSGLYSEFSMVYVPYDEKQGPEHDRSYVLPRDDRYKGEVVYDKYTVGAATRHILVYLPYDYDPERAEPYKTIYLTHGSGGSEMDWMTNGCAPQIMDNLIAEGRVESAVVVSLDNNNGLGRPDVVDDLVPYMEAHYHVSTLGKDRAFAGLSSGGGFTSNLYYEFPTEFGYFGVWSNGNGGKDLSELENLDFARVMGGAGVWDPQRKYYPAMNNTAQNIENFVAKLREAGLDPGHAVVPGAHDWATWPQLFRIMAEDFLSWTYAEDGTATHGVTGETVIVGPDGVAGTDDDDRVVNPTGKTLVQNAKVAFDAQSAPYVSLGNGFKLYGGEDGKIGTGDDVVADFGAYPQSDATGAVKDPVSWRLLDIKDGGATAVLISAHALNAVQFNLDAGKASNAWKDSNLRAWMNSRGGVSYNKGGAGDTVGFYDAAFSAADKEKIKLTTVKMDHSGDIKWDPNLYDTRENGYNGTTGTFPAYDRVLFAELGGSPNNETNPNSPWVLATTTGEDTQDYVYAISGEEYFAYFGPAYLAGDGWNLVNYRNGYMTATAYAIAQGSKNSNTQGMTGLADSWTRSPSSRTDFTGGGSAYGVFWSGTGSMNVGREVTNAQNGTTYGAIPMINVDLRDPAPDNFTQVDDLGADGSVTYTYIAPDLYVPRPMMTPVFYVYADEKFDTRKDAWAYITAIGLVDLANAQKGAIMVMNPVGDTWGSEDVDVYWELQDYLWFTEEWYGYDPVAYSDAYPAALAEHGTAALAKAAVMAAIGAKRGITLTYGQMQYLVAEDGGATFVSEHMTENARRIAGALLVGGTAPAGARAGDITLPAYIASSAAAVNYYKALNGAAVVDAAVNPLLPDTVTVYTNAANDLQRVVVDAAATALDADVLNRAWKAIFKRTVRQALETRLWDNINLAQTNPYGRGVLTDEVFTLMGRPVADELGLTVFDRDYNVAPAANANGGGWYEWVPSEAIAGHPGYNPGKKFVLVFSLHGGSDHPVFEAEANGWVDVAGRERFILVGPSKNDPGDPVLSNVNAGDFNAILAAVLEAYNIDESRIYVSGFSGGARSTNFNAVDNGHLLAAAAPVDPRSGGDQGFEYEQVKTLIDQMDLPYMLVQPRTQDTFGNGPLFGQGQSVQNFHSTGDKYLSRNNVDYQPAARPSALNQLNGALSLNNMTNLPAQDFETYPLWGFERKGLEIGETKHGQVYKVNSWYNAGGVPMVRFATWEDINHCHFEGYAALIWDFFKHFSRDPETREIRYSGTTEGVTVTFNAGGGVSPASARTGADGRLSALPTPVRNNDRFGGWYTAASGGELVTLDHVFTEDTTIYAHWTYAGQSSGATGTAPGALPDSALPFVDVRTGDWFYDAVAYAYRSGLVIGTSADKFSPNVRVTRAMLVTVLYRLEGEPAVSGALPFPDVKGGEWYSNAILWAGQKEIVLGYGSGAFAPNDLVSREQAVVILHRYAKAKGRDVSAPADLSPFADANSVSDWAVDAMKWAVAAGIIQGRTPLALVPKGTSTRAEVVTIFKRYSEKI
ncbi:MAG: S-layer homology domain-containing protein [Oscillospiraceae bacterium]|nr:S-layer homology domain-containing protein [Oscillospiraceae bacterium]